MLKPTMMGGVISVSLLLLVGCGAGEVVPLDLRAEEASTAKKADRVKVAVGIFEDSRPATDAGTDKARIGRRTHLGGGGTYFTVKGGQLGPAVSKVMADYLRMRGLDAWVVTPTEPRTPDIQITGRVREYQASAISHVGWTELTVRTKVDVEAEDLADQSRVRMTLNGQGQDVKVVFDTQDLEQLLTEAMNDSLKEFLQDTRVADRMMRLK